MSQEEQQHNKIVKAETKACDLCGETGRVIAVEMLPGGGILFECYHDKGKMHEWGEYEGFEDLRNIKVDRDNSTEIKCPKCNEIGVIKTERDYPKRPDRYSYRISHPHGRRCRLSGKNRDEALKLLGRYIAPEREGQQEKQQHQEQPISKQKTHRKKRHDLEYIACPECTKTGGASDYGYLVVIHQKGNGKNIQHRMQTVEQKRRFLDSVTSITLTSYRRIQVENEILKAQNQEWKHLFHFAEQGAARILGVEK